MLSVRAILLAALFAAFAGCAAAGDFAEREILGFSPDGRYFAFEEYGVQDGSGFPYSNVYVIEVAEDAWVSGTPVRVLLEGPDLPQENARAEAREQAADTLERLDIGRSPQHVASNPATQLNADFNFVLVNPRMVEPAIDKPFAVRLSSYALPAGADYCADFGETKGFQLDMIHGDDDMTVTLQRDERLPQSRGCPLDYQIADVYTYYPEAGPPAFAVLVRMIQVGFEGPDGRYLAVTGLLPAE
jgi:predicted secreted protein